MRSQFTKPAAYMLLAALFSLGVPAARAQQVPGDVAVVSIAPLDNLLKDTSYLLQACNVPEMGGLVTIMANQYTQGVDRSKPLGARVSLEGGEPSAIVFMPMTDRSQFFGALGGMGIEPDDLGDGLFEIDTGGQVVYAKETDGWMFLSQTENSFGELPADPAALLGNLPSNYDLAIRINASQVPEPLKQNAIEQIRMGYENSMAAQAGQTEEEQQAAKEMGEASIAQIEQLINDTDQLIFGWKVAKEDQRTYVDTGIKFSEGTKLAAQADMAKDLTSNYTNFFLPYASAKFRFSSIIAEEDRALAVNNFRNSLSQVETQLEQADLPDEARALVAELVAGLSSVMEETIQEGVFDGAGSVSVADNTLRILIGGHVADGNALAAEFKKAASELPDNPDIPKFDFDYETYNGVNLHRVSGPLKIADPAAKRVFGDELMITIGTGEKSYFIALDPSGDALVKSVIDQMAGSQDVKVSPFEGTIAFTDILKYAQSIAPNSILDNAVSTISEFAGNDQVEITSRVIEHGGLYRMSIDEGVMRTIGAAAKSGAGGGGGF